MNQMVTFEQLLDTLKKSSSLFDKFTNSFVKLEVVTDWEFNLINPNSNNDKYATNFFKANNNSNIIIYTLDSVTIAELEDWNEDIHKIIIY
jgi:hypothetical protein